MDPKVVLLSGEGSPIPAEGGEGGIDLFLYRGRKVLGRMGKILRT